MKSIKKVIKLVFCCAICVVLMLTTAACAGPNPVQVYQKGSYNKLNDGTVAENSKFTLNWDKKTARIILHDKNKNADWSYIPFQEVDDSYIKETHAAELQTLMQTDEKITTIDQAVAKYKETTKLHPLVTSAIVVTYYETATLYDNVANVQAQSINKSTYTMSVDNNVLKITYYFDKYQFAIPVEFSLTDEGLKVSIDAANIAEGDTYYVVNVLLAPYFTSVENSKEGNKDYYLFNPSGSGTIVYPQQTTESAAYQGGYTTTETVYDGDYNMEREEEVAPAQTVRMPVFGAVNKNRAVAAIITEGAECAKIKTVVGNQLTKYSYVGAYFTVRGYQETVQTLFTSSVVKAKLWADSMSPCKMSVLYCPLYDEEASYVGIANAYRKYLQGNGLLKTTTDDEKLLNLKIYGGMEVTKFIAGVPYDSMLSATNVKQAASMIADIENSTGTKLNANLIGFGQNGIDIGTIAGAYKLNGKFGSANDIKKLSSQCDASGSNLFFNFDMIRYNKSGSGISYSGDRAESANKSYTLNHYILPNFRVIDMSESHLLVGRDNLGDIASKISKTLNKWNLKGVSLDTLTSMIYSDYKNYKYYTGANCESQFSEIMNSFKANGTKIAASTANGYAAFLSDQVYDTPTSSSQYHLYSEDVPFYQIVLKGYVPMSGYSVNLATSQNEQFLKCVETGMGLTYSLINNYSNDLIDSKGNVFYGSVYSDNKDSITELAAKYKSYFESVKGATVKDCKILSSGVHETVFSNGVKVYVNYTAEDFETDNGTVAAGSYLVK